MSGTAPMEIWVKEKNPKPIIKTINKRIMSLFFKLNFMMFSNIIHLNIVIANQGLP